MYYVYLLFCSSYLFLIFAPSVYSSLLKWFFKNLFLILLWVLSLHFWVFFSLILMFFHIFRVLISVCSFWSSFGLMHGQFFWHAFIVDSVSLFSFFLIIRYDIWPQSLSFQILWEASFSRLLGGMAQDSTSSFT